MAGFIVANELADLNSIQSEMASIQNKNKVINQEQLAIYEQIFHNSPDCDRPTLFPPTAA